MDFIQFIIDFILHIDVHLAELIAQYGIWVYAILFLIIFCETGLVVTPFLPGDSLLFVAGALGSLPTNNINVHIMALALILAAILGDSSNYLIGRFFGEKLFSNRDSKIFKQSYLEKTHGFYEKYGGKTSFTVFHQNKTFSSIFHHNTFSDAYTTNLGIRNSCHRKIGKCYLCLFYTMLAILDSIDNQSLSGDYHTSE